MNFTYVCIDQYVQYALCSLFNKLSFFMVQYYQIVY